MNGIAASTRVEFRRASMRALDRKVVIATAEIHSQCFESEIVDTTCHSKTAERGVRECAHICLSIAAVIQAQRVAVATALHRQRSADAVEQASRRADEHEVIVVASHNRRGTRDRVHGHGVGTGACVQRGDAGVRRQDVEGVGARAERDAQHFDAVVGDAFGHAQAAQEGGRERAAVVQRRNRCDVKRVGAGAAAAVHREQRGQGVDGGGVVAARQRDVERVGAGAQVDHGRPAHALHGDDVVAPGGQQRGAAGHGVADREGVGAAA